jgi:hypothetical protein
MNEPFGLFAGIGVLVFLSCAGTALLRWIDWKRGLPPQR